MADPHAHQTPGQVPQGAQQAAAQGLSPSVPSRPGDESPVQPVRLERPWRDASTIALAILSALVGVQVLGVLVQPLLLFLAAVVVATAVSPIAGWLEQWMPRVVGVLLVFLAVLLVFGLFVWAIVPPLVQQVQRLVEEAPTLLEEAQAWLEERDFPGADSVEDRAQAALERAGSVAFSAAPSVFGTFVDVLVVSAMSAYLSISAPSMTRFLLSFVPAHNREFARSVLAETGQTMGGYVRGSVINGAILAVIVYVGLLVLGVDFPLVLAILAFIGEFIPVLGPMIAGGPAILIALSESPTLALVVFGFYFVVQQIESNLLLPLIMRTQASIPPLLTLFALVAGAAFAGFVGALLAIPLLGGFYVIVQRVIAPAVRAWTGAEPAPWQIGGGGTRRM